MNWLKELYFAPFRVLAVGVRIYVANRNRLTAFTAQPRVKAVLKGAVVVTALGWLAVWLFAGDEYRGRLTEAVKGLWSDYGGKQSTTPGSDAD